MGTHTKRRFKMSERKAVIKNADMSEEMQQDAVDCAAAALEKYSIEKDIAAYVKKEFDKKYNPTWHAIVGRNFGSYVTHVVSAAALSRGLRSYLCRRKHRLRAGGARSVLGCIFGSVQSTACPLCAVSVALLGGGSQ